MKKLILPAFLVTLFLFSQNVSANFLLNPGFEDGTWAIDGLPDGWTGKGGAGTWYLDWKNDAELAHSGSKYMSLGGQAEAAAWMWQRVTTVVPNERVTFSAWMKTDWGTPTGYLEINFKNASDESIYDYKVEIFSEVVETWTLYSISYTAPAETALVDFVIVGDGEGMVCFDDVSAVPEPGILALSGVAVIALLLSKKYMSI
ncbi:MAG: carbohydrate binding domain-containing protein [Candidatus Aureabacteria bacterium]|nr:carbohydrate binding domain-containing protein [Candidatus Auribacterota bacterium]